MGEVSPAVGAMPRLRRNTRRFKVRAINSMVLAIELFNRPNEINRTESVLIWLHHAFEMLFKAAIYQDRGRVSDQGHAYSFSFSRCLGIARSDLGFLNQDEALTLEILNDLRDCAYHNLLDLSEPSLYIHAQAGVTLFNQIIYQAFGERLADHIPSRVLPISVDPPRDMLLFLDSEFTQIQRLIGPGRRRSAEAGGRLKHFMIMESNLTGEGGQPTESEVSGVVRRLRNGATWQEVFPGVASLNLDSQGHGLDVSIRLTRSSGAPPVRIVREGESGAEDATIVGEVDSLDRYSMGPKLLASHLDLTVPKTRALIHHLDLTAQPDCYKEIRIGNTVYKRYSSEALTRLREAKDSVDIEVIWQEYRGR